MLVGTTVLQHHQALPTEFRIIQNGTFGALTFPPTRRCDGGNLQVCRAARWAARSEVLTTRAGGPSRTKDGPVTTSGGYSGRPRLPAELVHHLLGIRAGSVDFLR